MRIDYTDYARAWDHTNPHIHIRIYDAANIYGQKYRLNNN